MKKLLLLIASILLFCTSCKYLNKTCSYSDLRVEINTIGLKKIPLSESRIKSYNSWIDQHSIFPALEKIFPEQLCNASVRPDCDPVEFFTVTVAG